LEGGRFILIVGGLGMALALSSCGSDSGPKPDPPGPIPTAVRELQRSFAAGDLDRVCARMTSSARRQAGLMAHGKVESCAKDMRQAIGLIEQGGGFGDVDATEIAAVRREGNRATVTVALDDWHTAVPLVARGGAWKLDSFFGIPTAEALSRLARRRDALPAAAEDPPPDAREVVVTGGRIAVTMLTAFGSFEFSDCRFELTAYADEAGRTWTHDFERDGPGAACGDIEQCGAPYPGERYDGKANSGVPMPWRGTLRADGDAYVHEVDACFWTCVGFFEGRLSLRLERDGDRWRAEDVDLAIGREGLRMAGDFESRS
jgi:hypothetical protein